MRKLLAIIAVCTLNLSFNLAYADESTQYSQKTLPNGDIESVMTSSDGTAVTSIQHKDGSTETTSITSDGSKSVTITHPDGSSETKVMPKK